MDLIDTKQLQLKSPFVFQEVIIRETIKRFEQRGYKIESVVVPFAIHEELQRRMRDLSLRVLFASGSEPWNPDYPFDFYLLSEGDDWPGNCTYLHRNVIGG